MCGIAGVIHPNEGVALASVRRMNQAQAHRGPDGAAIRSLRTPRLPLVFGHRRLAIQDLSPAGAQPMENPVTGDVVVYNGEIYNAVELRQELRRNGAVFRGHSDTEVLLAAFERWGIGCLSRIFGMFAFGLYAARSKTLYLARDPLGIKPLYWARPDASTFVFASEVRGLLASSLVEDRVDRYAIESGLAYGTVVGPRTMIEAARLLEPGTWAGLSLASEGSGSEPRFERYWTFSAEPHVQRSPSLAAEVLRPQLRAAVESHLVSDVPVALFLSSGIDSTAIAILAADARAGAIDTFCVGLADDVALNEAPIAQRTARRLGTRHHEVLLSEKDALRHADQWFAAIDQPSVDGLNTFLISRAARQLGIVVALSGLGGDEMFGGYSTFQQVPWLVRAAWLGRAAPSRLVAPLIARWARGSQARKDKLSDLLEPTPSIGTACLSRRRLMSNAQMAALGMGAGKTRLFLPPEYDASYGVPSRSAWAGIRAVETRMYMGNMLLRDADVFGMAHGLEIRVPFLDRRVVQAALTMTRPELELRRGPNKPWLVEALDGRIPREVVARSKRGFSVPQARWMRGPLRGAFEERVETVARSGLVDGKGVREVWRRFLCEPEGRSWSRAWMLGALGEWLGRPRAGAPGMDAAREDEARA